MPITTNTPMLPPWLGLPIAGLVLVVIAAHILALQHNPETPPTRKRIRTANGVLMMLVTTLLAYAFCIATPAQPSTYVLTWLAIIGLLTIVIGVALIDVLNTLKLQADSRRELRREAARALNTAPTPPSPPPQDHNAPDHP